ncbi:hypothetical protein ScFU149_17590 [Streptococcus canis]|nr:hypothetical protein ScOT1_11530 [Streptococcus canis]GFE46228.1 hypothetical protein ScFU6_19970 [Streptococcus canis]GFG41123.1 hypothetical protein ScFU29_00280 [Streptococcus canis]GFK31643.1 hypothetical protein ScFU149_17590 [Streptococcus canis]
MVKQLLTSVAYVHQNLTKVKVFVTLVNMYALKKVKLVNNGLSWAWQAVELAMFNKFNYQLVNQTNELKLRGENCDFETR